MKKIYFILIIFNFCLFAKDTLSIRVTNFPPNYYKDGDKWTGLDVELAEALITYAGYEVKHLELPWSRALAYLAEGKLDIMMNLSKTADREKEMNFIGPERKSIRAFITREDYKNQPILSLSDLVRLSQNTNLLIGIQKDAKYSPEFDFKLINDPDFSKNFDIVTDGNLNIKKTVLKRIIGFIEDKNWAVYQKNINPEFEDLAIHEFIINQENVYFGISKAIDSKTYAKLVETNELLEKEGIYQTIRDKWVQVK